MTGNMDKAVESAFEAFQKEPVQRAGQNSHDYWKDKLHAAITAALPHLGAQREEIALALARCECVESDPNWTELTPMWRDHYLAMADAILRLPTVQGQACSFTRDDVDKWRGDAFEAAAQIVERYLLPSDARYIVTDIRVLKPLPPSPPADSEGKL